MPRLLCRIAIACALAMLALASTREAEAQVVAAPGEPLQPSNLGYDLVTGVQYDRMNLVAAQKRLVYLQEKQRREAARGKTAAAARTSRWIASDRYRIAVDDWLIRKNSLVDFCYYPPLTDPISGAAISQAARPGPDLYVPQGGTSPGTMLPSLYPNQSVSPNQNLSPNLNLPPNLNLNPNPATSTNPNPNTDPLATPNPNANPTPDPVATPSTPPAPAGTPGPR